MPPAGIYYTFYTQNGTTMSPKKTITTLIFDLGQVIVSFDHMELCRRASKHSPHEPEEIFTRMFHSGLMRRFETGLLAPDDFYREACRALDMNLPLEQFKTIWNTIFTLNTDTARIIERLQGFQLLLLSNTNCWHFNYCLENYPVLRLFNSLILSYEVGAYKPEKKIFEAALSSASARAQECIFIDDIAHYTEAARSMGIHTHTFTTAEKLEQFLNDLKIL
jgi:HAD superfamily hydrolase (TIGR01509 family)